MHIPVLENEVINYLSPALKFGGLSVDATVGAGGHAKAILENNRKCRLIGIDQDQLAIKLAQENLKKFKDRIKLIHGNSVDLGQIVKQNCHSRPLLCHSHESGNPDSGSPIGVGDDIKAILFDLGISSMQFDQADRGFSFRVDGPLDMRMDRSQNLTAGEIINRWPPDHLEQILKDYGEEWQFKKIVRVIIEERKKQKIETTRELVQIIEKALDIRYGGKGMRIHPATKTFQALRITVNGELEVLKEVLPTAVDLLASGGRIAVISFHSLEDRIVKNIFRNLTKNCLCSIKQPECNCGNNNAKLKILIKKPIIPSEEEIKLNPRSRSAKMRVAEKL